MNGYIRQATGSADLVNNDLLLEFKLGGVVDVLPLATAAFTRPKMRAARLNAGIRGFQHGHAFGVGKAAFILRDAGGDAFAGDGVGDENRTTLVASNGAATVCHRG